ncbi:plant virulence effector HPE1-like domain-containing protein [Sinorhizobium medicae]|uniref:plant virulence effector HPE1-like domain-containing protein n=1 Tax=Sinorhizobium medicae TaxID=110321 RepID=UPI000381F8F4|nr:plant virulence effector HPE1-like domain-containing protein [Sinorhizobium medicae]WQO46352.1 plant virulence effector HPE1-like domain-containing protein [Sinorhizobium medicae]WQO66477.1 plant virulence effector HPE1-like domain-containing protein [Sinorhizobium medicae]WQO73608.1 plant virulence effector HPE1-like domain-containing protein [Sinorhizobium medicae]WQO92953.1 plant virulence effector HPE1-like domain-containing protein [Sinorhizobium medicae]
MRSLLITAALVSAAGPTAASSIEDVTSGEAVNSSVATVSCADCPPLQPKKKHSYVVPELAPGTDRVEIKEIHGAVKSVRTEAWLGGSPVIFVNDAFNEAIRAAAMKTGEQAVADRSATAFPPAISEISIDGTAKTASVATISQAMPVTASEAGGSRKIDPAAFDLRLN